MKTKQQVNNIKTQTTNNKSGIHSSVFSDEDISALALEMARENQTTVLKGIAKKLTRCGILYSLANIGVVTGIGIAYWKVLNLQPSIVGTFALAATPVSMYYGISTLKAAHRIRKLSKASPKERKGLIEQYEYDGLLPIYTLCKKLIYRLCAIEKLYEKDPTLSSQKAKNEIEINELMGFNEEKIEEFNNYGNYCEKIWAEFLKEY